MKKDDLHALRAEALLKLAEGDSDTAFEKLKSLVFLDVDTEDAYIVTGSLLRKKGELVKAERIHRSILEKKDLSKEIKATAIRELILDFLAAGDYKSVLLFTEKADLSLMPHRALALEKLFMHVEAAELYKKCTKINQKYIKNAARAFFAASKQFEEDRGRTMKYLEYAVKCDPRFFEPQAEEANLFYAAGRRSKALSILESLIKYGLPRSIEHMNVIEDIYYAASDINMLLKEVMKVINSGSPCLPLYLYAARNYTKMGEEQKAKSLIDIYAERFGFKTALAVLYADIKQDETMQNYFRARAVFKCDECLSEHKEYRDKCSVCGGLGTLIFA